MCMITGRKNRANNRLRSITLPSYAARRFVCEALFMRTIKRSKCLWNKSHRIGISIS
jgi:hypothetical protein